MRKAKDSIWGFFKQYPVFVLFIASYTVVHLVFEYNFWLAPDQSIFAKYAEVSDGNPLLIAQAVYFAKATWMFVLVWLLVLGLSLRAAITYSFVLYSLELLFFFEVQLYIGLNLLLALALLIELWVKPEVKPLSGR